MTLIRTINPELRAAFKNKCPQAKEIRLDNGLTIYAIDAGTEDVVKLEIIYPSGAASDKNFTVAMATHQLIDSGTATKKALEIAEGLDYYGSYLQTDFGPDWKTISLYTLSRFFNDTLSVFMEILNGAVYREDEIETWKTRSIQSLKVNREKVSWLARAEFNEALFGKNHPYGFTSMEKDFKEINSGDLGDFSNPVIPYTSRYSCFRKGK
jgi:predicted Zn-dependent peptidase